MFSHHLSPKQVLHIPKRNLRLRGSRGLSNLPQIAWKRFWHSRKLHSRIVDVSDLSYDFNVYSAFSPKTTSIYAET